MTTCWSRIRKLPKTHRYARICHTGRDVVQQVISIRAGVSSKPNRGKIVSVTCINNQDPITYAMPTRMTLRRFSSLKSDKFRRLISRCYTQGWLLDKKIPTKSLDLKYRHQYQALQTTRNDT